MIIIVIGRQRRTGTSKKTGKPYDFSEIYFLSTSPFVEGQVGDKCTVDPSVCTYDKIYVGREYIADFDNTGRLVSFKQK